MRAALQSGPRRVDRAHPPRKAPSRRGPATASLRWLAAVLLGLAVLTPAPATASAGDATADLARNALIVGSSSVLQSFGRVMKRGLEREGYQVRVRGIPSAGLARPDFRDMQALAETWAVDRETALVVVYLGVNDGQPLWLRPHERKASRRRWLAWGDERWSRVYERRARRLFDRLCARGAGRVLAVLPVDVMQPRLQRRLHRVRQLQARAATRSTCAQAVSTGGDWGRFVVGGLPKRRRDGFHMTPWGARVVWNRIRERASLAPSRRRASSRRVNATPRAEQAAATGMAPL